MWDGEEVDCGEEGIMRATIVVLVRKGRGDGVGGRIFLCIRRSWFDCSLWIPGKPLLLSLFVPSSLLRRGLISRNARSWTAFWKGAQIQMQDLLASISSHHQAGKWVLECCIVEHLQNTLMHERSSPHAKTR